MCRGHNDNVSLEISGIQVGNLVKGVLQGCLFYTHRRV